MKDVTSLSIDLAKNVFQLHGTDNKGKAILKKKLNRSKLLELIATMKPCHIYIEGCGTANYWGRKFESYGHQTSLINPKYVKAYVKRNKNDYHDAAAISSASRDPEMRFSAAKTQEQQDMQSIHRFRDMLIKQRTSLVNQIRGLLAEYGFTIPQGINNVRTELKLILAGTADQPTADKLTDQMLECLHEEYRYLKELDNRIKYYDKKLELAFKSNETCKRLEKIPGIGVLGATIITSVLGNGGGFKNGRHFAAFLGLTPRQHSSGGKTKLLGISKGGDTYIRNLLIHGARSVLISVSRKATKSGLKELDKLSMWILRLIKEKGYNKAAVALANKIARIACSMIQEGIDYNRNYKPEYLKA